MEGRKNSKTVSAARNTIRGHFIYIASSNLSDNPTRTNAQTALDSIDEMLLYIDADADTYYYQAEANKTMGNYTEAISLADQALDAHKGGARDKAKIYFVKGEALMFSGANSEAAEAFGNALYGFLCAPGMALSLGGESPLQTRQGELLA